MSLLADGMLTLTGIMLANAGERIVYARGQDTCELYAVPGRSDLEADKGDTVVRIESQDFIFNPTHLVLGLQRVEPREGDVIRLRRDGVEYVHDVLAAGDGRPFTVDPHRTSMRVRTRLRERRLV